MKLPAYDLAKENNGRLKLYGNSTLATIKTLENGQGTQGLTLVIPWSSKNPSNRPFAQAARKFWGGDVSWRTAGAYDATSAIATGLGIDSSRNGLQKALENPTFSSNTINGEIKFLPNGDRAGKAIIVQVRPSKTHPTGYDFMPISP